MKQHDDFQGLIASLFGNIQGSELLTFLLLVIFSWIMWNNASRVDKAAVRLMAEQGSDDSPEQELEKYGCMVKGYHQSIYAYSEQEAYAYFSDQDRSVKRSEVFKES